MIKVSKEKCYVLTLEIPCGELPFEMFKEAFDHAKESPFKNSGEIFKWLAENTRQLVPLKTKRDYPSYRLNYNAYHNMMIVTVNWPLSNSETDYLWGC